MEVRVLFFGLLKDVAGVSSDILTLPENATARTLLEHYKQRLPRLQAMAASLALAVNQEYAGPETKLKQGDEIAVLPPVSGGSDFDSRVELVHTKIDVPSVIEAVKRRDCGALVVFEGTVRDHTRGRRTLYLDYEAYEDMALRQMRQLASGAVVQFQVKEIALIHRLGRLEIGEVSVLIAVSSIHRAQAFDACRWLIDTLKRTVPVWKKEYFEDGAVWVDGEPFPPEIPTIEIARAQSSQDQISQDPIPEDQISLDQIPPAQGTHSKGSASN